MKGSKIINTGEVLFVCCTLSLCVKQEGKLKRKRLPNGPQNIKVTKEKIQ